MSEVKNKVVELEAAANELLSEHAACNESFEKLGDALTPLVFQVSRPAPVMLEGFLFILKGLKAVASGMKSTFLAVAEAVPEITAAVTKAQDKAGAVPFEEWMDALNTPKAVSAKKRKAAKPSEAN